MGRFGPLVLVMSLVWALAPGIVLAEGPVQGMTASPRANDRLGVCFVNAAGMDTVYTEVQIEERYGRTLAAGAGWTRWPLYWPEIETSPGTFNYAAQDAVVLRDLRHGLKIDPILLGTPALYSTGGSLETEMPGVGRKGAAGSGAQGAAEVSAASSPPQNLYQPVFSDGTDTPGVTKTINLQNYWARFVYETVNHYRPGSAWGQERGLSPEQGIRHWEIWNEPDWTLFWSGTVGDYYRLLKVGYLAAKHADPQAVIILGGLAFWHNQSWFPSFLDRVVADPNPALRDANNHYFNVVAWHWYSHPSDLYFKSYWSRWRMAERGIYGKAIWVNETNVPVWNDYPGYPDKGDDEVYLTYRATMEEQAAFVLQALAWGFAAAVERIFIFQLYDDCVWGPGEAYGLRRNFPQAPCSYANAHPSPGTARPAFTATLVAAEHFRGLTFSRRGSHTDWEELEFRDEAGRRVVVAWASQGHAVNASISARSHRATRIDQYGNTATIYPSGGSYSLTLPAATNDNLPGSTDYMIGGRPYILVEASQVHFPIVPMGKQDGY